MDAKTVALLAKLDKTLGKVMKKVGPIKLKPQKKRSPYQTLVESVVYQQLTGKAAATIFKRVLALYSGTRFPTPEQLINTTDERLRAAGLSRAKTLALKDIAAKTLDGTVPNTRRINKMDDAEIMQRLTSIRGVGPWTVEMLLMFKLGRPDIFPATDYGVRKGFALVYGRKELPPPKQLLKFSERWQPYRSTAAWYLWRALELP